MKNIPSPEQESLEQKPLEKGVGECQWLSVERTSKTQAESFENSRGRYLLEKNHCYVAGRIPRTFKMVVRKRVKTDDSLSFLLQIVAFPNNMESNIWKSLNKTKKRDQWALFLADGTPFNSIALPGEAVTMALLLQKMEDTERKRLANFLKVS